MPETAVEVLRQAKALISNRQNWTQQCEARNKDLQPCPPNHPDAVAFCISGADYTVEQYNDTHTHRQVLQLIDTAILIARHPGVTK